MDRLSRWQVKIVRTATTALSNDDWEDLTGLFNQVYEVEPETVRRSVSGKRAVYRAYHRSTGRLVGAAASGVIRVELPSGERATLFAGGDTVFLPEARGIGLLQQMGLSEFVRLVARDPWSPKYLFGLVMTYKLYRMIDRTFLDYWPRYDCTIPEQIRVLMETAGPQLFGEDWRGAEQPVEADRRGRGDVLEIPKALMANPAIRFFADRNPRYLAGDALPVLIRLDARNVGALVQSSLGRLLNGKSSRSSASQHG